MFESEWYLCDKIFINSYLFCLSVLIFFSFFWVKIRKFVILTKNDIITAMSSSLARVFLVVRDWGIQCPKFQIHFWDEASPKLFRYRATWIYSQRKASQRRTNGLNSAGSVLRKEPEKKLNDHGRNHWLLTFYPGCLHTWGRKEVKGKSCRNMKLLKSSISIDMNTFFSN